MRVGKWSVALLPLSAISSIQADCPDLSYSKELTDSLVFAWEIEYGAKDILHVCMTSQSEGWLGWGISEDGMMVGSEAVIGLPGDGTVLRYNLNGKSSAAVAAMNSTNQTLMNPVIEQKDGVTLMSFETFLDEDMLGQNNTFIFAEATSNTFGYHGSSRGNFTLFIEEPPKPTPRPTVVGKSGKGKSSKSVSNQSAKSSKPGPVLGGTTSKPESSKSGKSQYSSKSGKSRK